MFEYFWGSFPYFSEPLMFSFALVAIGYPERHVRKASHRGSKQQ